MSSRRSRNASGVAIRSVRERYMQFPSPRSSARADTGGGWDRPHIKVGGVHTDRVQHGRLGGTVPVVPLVDHARPPTAEVGRCPSAGRDRSPDVMPRPRSGTSRVFQYPPPSSHRFKRGTKTSGVIAQAFRRIPVCHPSRAAEPVVPPSRAGRVCHHRMRPGVQPRVPRFVPRVHAVESVVAASGLHVESGNCHRNNLSSHASARPDLTSSWVTRNTRQPSSSASAYFSTSPWNPACD